MIRKLTYILLLLGIVLDVGAQSMNAYIKAADKAFEEEDYYSALEFYSTAYSMDSSRTDLRYDIAQSARLFAAYNRAKAEYEFILMEDTISAYPDAAYYLAEMLHKTGDYDAALDKYQLYLSEYSGTNDYLTKRAQMEVESVQWAVDEQSNSNTDFELEHLGPEINSPHTEFGAFPLDTALLFTSLRFPNEASKHDPKRTKSKILSHADGRQISPVAGDINESDLSVAHNAFNNDQSIVYYTICDYVTDSYLECDLYSRDVNADGSFSNPVKLPFGAEGDSVTYTQPTVGMDIATNQEFLIFSSNRTGGKGKMDLYKADILGNNQFGDIIPLESINTPEDEISPFFHRASQILYFSSNGKIGFGGHDIYSSDYNAGTFSGNYNLGSPQNSSYNDIYYVLTDDEKTSYLSSNRTGSYFIDDAHEACCYDIYKGTTENPFLQLNVLTFDQLTMDSLKGTTVQLINPSNGETVEELTVLDGIDHLFDLRRGREYMVITSKDGWNPDTMSLTTRGDFPDNLITKKVYLTTDRILLDLSTFDKQTLLALNGTTLKVVNKNNGDTIYMNSLPNSNQYKVYVDPGASYEVITSKPEYTTESISIDLTGPIDEQILTRKIFLTKISLDDYLPLALYFDNDRPDPGSRDLYSPKAYSDLVNQYYERKDEFIRRRTRRMNAVDRETTTSDLNEFFDEEVMRNYQTLNEFMDELYVYLEDGRNANLTLKGYTSPLAASRYNLALGQRRVSSIKNEIARYRGGIFMPFLESGQLVITDISFGEELSPENVSDRRSDTRRSIYSLDASQERRVEILSIKIN